MAAICNHVTRKVVQCAVRAYFFTKLAFWSFFKWNLGTKLSRFVNLEAPVSEKRTRKVLRPVNLEEVRLKKAHDSLYIVL